MAAGDYIEDLIEKYVSGKMSDGERVAFEKEMDRDPGLRKQVEEEKLLAGAVIHARKQELKDYIKTETIREKRQKENRMMWMSLAAAAVLAVGAGFFVYVHNSVHSGGSKSEDISKVRTDSTTRTHGGQKTDSALANTNPQMRTPAVAHDSLGVANQLVSGTNPMEKLAFAPPALITEKPAVQKDKVLSDKVFSNRSVLSGEGNLATDSTISAQKKEITGQYKYKDTIRGDVHIKDSSIAIRIVPDDRKLVIDTAVDATMKVSYWNSPLHFKGYRYYIKTLSLYGVSTHARIALNLYEGIFYLKIAGKYYRLTGEDYVYDFSNPVTNTKTLNALKKTFDD